MSFLLESGPTIHEERRQPTERDMKPEVRDSRRPAKESRPLCGASRTEIDQTGARLAQIDNNLGEWLGISDQGH